jgi:hypothetical protein
MRVQAKPTYQAKRRVRDEVRTPPQPWIGCLRPLWSLPVGRLGLVRLRRSAAKRVLTPSLTTLKQRPELWADLRMLPVHRD